MIIVVQIGRVAGRGAGFHRVLVLYMVVGWLEPQAPSSGSFSWRLLTTPARALQGPLQAFLPPTKNIVMLLRTSQQAPVCQRLAEDRRGPLVNIASSKRHWVEQLCSFFLVVIIFTHGSKPHAA